MGHKIFDTLASLSTEGSNRRSLKIDGAPFGEILRIINREDDLVASSVKKELKHIEKAAKLVLGSLLGGGRLIFIGAGTSGRLGVIEAAECPPTFGTDPDLILGIMAGGDRAVFRSREGSEDEGASAVAALRRVKLSNKDVVCGVAASMRTPYVVAAIAEAKRVRSKTILVTTNPRRLLNEPGMKMLRQKLDASVCVDVGPEVIAGSTRMKSGTAQKMVLNMITTSVMIRLGKVYGNKMVDLKMNSKKLQERGKRVIMEVTGADYETAEKYLRVSSGHVKTAIVMIMKNVSAPGARRLIKKSDGFVKKAIGR